MHLLMLVHNSLPVAISLRTRALISACERKTDASDVTNSGERDPRDVNAIVVEAIQLYSCKVK